MLHVAVQLRGLGTAHQVEEQVLLWAKPSAVSYSQCMKFQFQTVSNTVQGVTHHPQTIFTVIVIWTSNIQIPYSTCETRGDKRSDTILPKHELVWGRGTVFGEPVLHTARTAAVGGDPSSCSSLSWVLWEALWLAISHIASSGTRNAPEPTTLSLPEQSPAN